MKRHPRTPTETATKLRAFPIPDCGSPGMQLRRERPAAAGAFAGPAELRAGLTLRRDRRGARR